MAIRSAACRSLECNSRVHAVCVCVFLWGVQEDEPDPLQCGRHSSAEETALLLPEHTDSVLRYIDRIKPELRVLTCQQSLRASSLTRVGF